MTTQDSTSETIEIQLRSGNDTIVETVDSDLSKLKWLESKRLNNSYAQLTTTPNGKTVLMHRMIVERMINRPLATKEYVDHINGIGLDNRRCNLRLATHSQNLGNSRVSKNNTSGYRGVYYIKRCKRYLAKIGSRYLGYYSTAEEAYEVYKAAAIAKWGEFANV